MAALRRLLALGGVGLLVWATLAGAAAAQAGWTIDRFDVRLTVQPDGSVEVVERIEVDFTGLTRRGIFRVIPVRFALSSDDPALPSGVAVDAVWREMPIDRIAVASSAPDDLEKTGPGLTGHTLTLRVGDPDTTITGPQWYELRYRVRGALNDVDGAAELVWNATGHEWEAPIREATVTVEGAPVAEVACVRGPLGSTQPCDAAVRGDRGTMRAAELPPGSGATITAVFASGAIDTPAPIVRERWTIERALVGHGGSVPLAALTALLGLGGVGALVWRQGRDRVTRGGMTIDGRVEEPVRRGLLSGRQTPVQYRPPGDLRPGQLGVLVDERVDPVDVTATIVDLAVRGHLQIEETVSGRIRKNKDWTLRRLLAPDGDALLPYEQLLVAELFSAGDEQALSELEGSWASSYEKISKAMYADAVARGWFSRSPEDTRALWLALGLLGIVVAGGLTWALVRWTTIGLVGVPLVLAAALLMMLSGKMPHRTAKGSLRLVETLGFREFISTAEADRMAFAEQENLFLRYLPYAVVFGATAKWAKAFASLGVEEASAVGGAWYLASDGRPPSFVGLSSSLSAFSSRTATSLTTSPASSGGGGGGSGGGGGGGGGGSW